VLRSIRLEAPRQQLVDAIDFGAGDTAELAGQPSLRIGAIQPGGFKLKAIAS